jgi:hypothetical protein
VTRQTRVPKRFTERAGGAWQGDPAYQPYLKDLLPGRRAGHINAATIKGRTPECHGPYLSALMRAVGAGRGALNPSHAQVERTDRCRTGAG